MHARRCPSRVHLPPDVCRLAAAYFRDHATSRFIVEMIERHDRTRFAVFAISLGSNDKTATRRVEKVFQHFIEVRLKSRREIVEFVRSLEIDIAIDIAVDLADFTQCERANLLALHGRADQFLDTLPITRATRSEPGSALDLQRLDICEQDRCEHSAAGVPELITRATSEYEARAF